MMKKQPTLEQAMQRLDEIVKQMDDGGLPLEDALKLFEEGTGLVRLCDGKLRDARLKVETLSQGLEPKPQEVSEA
ncbi:exodeoxyribonuclease VII small subunit [Clostridiaceae bacterium NSJ-31]|uniref:Exodeoxyribonuclease 7 small subunit n=2 Tax=Ligaoa zhengdingensis TaxID=2763658 RepID=A0A926HZ28_9FIRM|nr:exodeoxyribonuclease VII small subunit [Ligaoa zhengdingensis]